jgi:endonuclease/exonuclease/phosphatase family metal-dependent hydrolase
MHIIHPAPSPPPPPPSPTHPPRSQLDFLASSDGGAAFPPLGGGVGSATVTGHDAHHGEPTTRWRWVGELDVRDRDSRDSAVMFDEAAVGCAQWGTFWLSHTPDAPGSKVENSTLVRTATWAAFGVRAWGWREGDSVRGAHVLFVNTHLDHLGEVARRQQAHVIRTYVAALQAKLGIAHVPVVLTGDFNALRRSAAWRALTDPFGAGVTFSDAWHAARSQASTAAASGPFASFHGFLGLAVESPLFRVPMVAGISALAAVTDRLPLCVAPTDMHIDWILTSGMAPAEGTYHHRSAADRSATVTGWRLASVAVVPYVELQARALTDAAAARTPGSGGGAADGEAVQVAPSDHHPVVAEWEVYL